MKLIEQFMESRTGRKEDCEDTYFFNQHFAAVIDGATNVSGRLYQEKTPGQLASSLVKQVLSTLQGPENIFTIIEKINENYERHDEKINISCEEKSPPHLRPSASMVIFSKYFRELWFIGDCQAYFQGENFQNPKMVDQVFEKAREIFVKADLLRGISKNEVLEKDSSFEYIRPFIQKQYYFQNKTPVCEFSYAVINGLPIPKQLIKKVKVPLDAQYISLASDGYRNIYSTLAESEKELARLLKEDPLCINESKGVMGLKKGNVSFDDRTYLKIKI